MIRCPAREPEKTAGHAGVIDDFTKDSGF